MKGLENIIYLHYETIVCACSKLLRKHINILPKSEVTKKLPKPLIWQPRLGSIQCITGRRSHGISHIFGKILHTRGYQKKLIYWPSLPPFLWRFRGSAYNKTVRVVTFFMKWICCRIMSKRFLFHFEWKNVCWKLSESQRALACLLETCMCSYKVCPEFEWICRPTSALHSVIHIWNT